MIYRTILAVALATVALGSARAETVWIGSAFIDAVSGPASCTSTFAVGDFGRLVFRPRGSAIGNSGDSQLAYVTSRSGFQMLVHNGDFKTNSPYVSQSVGSTGSIGTGTGKVESWSQSPALPMAKSDDNIEVTAKFSSFFRITGCFVTLRAKLVQR